MVKSSRWRLAAFWLAQGARALADGCLGGALVRQMAGQPAPAAETLPWLPMLVLYLLLALCSAVLSDRLSARRVLLGACLFCTVAVVLCGTLHAPPLACLLLVTAGAALHGPARDALLPAAAHSAAWPLVRVVGAMRAATAAGLVAGILLQPDGFALVLAAALLLNLLALLATLPARFPQETETAAGAPLLRQGPGFLGHPDTRDPLLALIGLAVLLVTGWAALSGAPESVVAQPALYRWIGLGTILGALLAGCQPHPYRVLGLVPAGVTGLSATLLGWVWLGGAGGPALGFLTGTLAALTAVPLWTAYLTYLPGGARGLGVAWRELSVTAATLLALGFLFAGPLGRFEILAALAALAIPTAWWAFFRAVAEQVVEVLLVPCYRLRAHGPGLAQFPLRGPVLVLANHVAWLDPFWICKFLPRRTIPLMLSTYYDQPIVRCFMTRVFHAIRVENRPYRHEAPELQEAIAALDRGDCVLIFPEGMLRRKEEQTLRLFARGIWHILHERPETPVVVCWIEGGWGSFTSHHQGPPMRNKPLDWRRRIDIVFGEPRRIEVTLLQDQRAMRHHLMQTCLDARRYLE